MLIALFLVVAQQIAIQCIGVDCQQMSYPVVKQLIEVGTLELIFEVYGFIKIYVRRDKNRK